MIKIISKENLLSFSVKILLQKAEESRKSWQFYPIQISAASTDSKTGEEPTLTRIYDINDYFKAFLKQIMKQLQLPKLPSSMNEIEGGQPVVFHFMEKKPEIAILPVYIIKKDEKEPITRETFLKSSGSERKHLERSLSKATTEIQTARDLSIKKGSVTTTPPSSVLSTPSAHKKIDAGKVAKSDSSAKKKSKSKRVTAPVSLTKSVDEGYYFYFSNIL
uniref:DUF4708 domain-containing protein n=1 Tax=Elaeophora elaphi TaxID=1147741 RepID=A0A0R3RUK7_9BILA